jgi:death-on-curing protein
MKQPIWLSKETVLTLHLRLLSEFGGAAGMRDEGLLDSALGRPQNLFAYGKPTIHQLAASYAFALVRNHAFIDGNKRVAFTAAALFLAANGFRLNASETDAVVKTLGLAAHHISEADYAEWLKENTTRI